MTIVIARAKPVKETVVRSPHLRNFQKESFTRKGPLKNLSTRNPIGKPLIVKKDPSSFLEFF